MGSLVLVALGLLLAGCGGAQPIADEIESNETELRVGALPRASRALLEAPLPGCSAKLLRGAVVALLRHPTADDLAVALVDGEALCIDTLRAVFATDPAALRPALRIPTTLIAHDEPQGDDPVPVIGGGASPRARQGLGGDEPQGDDPVPIHREANVRGDQPADDDPVPIRDPSGSAQAAPGDGDDVGDDPVPIQPGALTRRPPAM